MLLCSAQSADNLTNTPTHNTSQHSQHTMAEWAGQWAGLAGSYTRGVVRRLVELPGMTVCSDPDLTLDQARSLKLGRCPTPSIVLISTVSPGCSGLGGLRVLLLPARGGQRHLAGRGGRHRHRHLLPPHGEYRLIAVLYLYLYLHIYPRISPPLAGHHHEHWPPVRGPGTAEAPPGSRGQ